MANLGWTQLDMALPHESLILFPEAVDGLGHVLMAMTES